MSTSRFGFSTEPNSGNFMPIIKYDARSGRMFRVDRVNTGQGFSDNPVDITAQFKAQCDFENLEIGWINFAAGSAPSFTLIKMGANGQLDQTLPPKPSAQHKNGLRFICKLAKEIASDKPVREIAGVSKAFLGAIEKVYEQYLSLRHTQPGKLPVLAFDGMPVPVKTGSGEKSSTNYHPKFQIIGWAARGDLQWTPVNTELPPAQQNTQQQGAQPNQHAPQGNGGVPPNTGSTYAPPPGGQQQQPQQPQYTPPPQQPQQQTVNDGDFG